ncbi:MAG TPA: MarR family transcriptional regulator [Clostridia bacterium]|nr:MarR family transcriptional regulator [Clostridia bacterium]
MGDCARLNDWARLVHQFAMLSGSRAACGANGARESISMVEARMLETISRNKGINVSELAALWDRTKGAISQTATKLERKGCIARHKQEGNAKTVMLYPTDKGMRLLRERRCRDSAEISEAVGGLLRAGCTEDEIQNFFRVMEQYVGIMAAGNRAADS